MKMLPVETYIPSVHNTNLPIQLQQCGKSKRRGELLLAIIISRPVLACFRKAEAIGVI